MQAHIDESNKRYRLNLSPFNFVSKILDNRYLIYANELLVKYFAVFNFNSLFLSGEPGWTGGINGYGQFHLLELLFLIFGCYFLIKQRQYLEIVCLSLALLVAPISSVIQTNTNHISLQSCFLILIISVIVAVGMKNLFAKVLLSRYRYLSVTVITVSYLGSLLLWGHNYFDRFPLYAEEQFNFKDRILSRYLSLTNQPLTVVTPHAYGVWRNYLFYNNLYTKANARELAPQFNFENHDDRFFENITFTSDCHRVNQATTGATVVVAVESQCQSLASLYEASSASWLVPRSDIAAIKDSGSNYYIFNDRLCPATDLSAYLHIQNRRDFSLETTDKSTFCHHWLVKFF